MASLTEFVAAVNQICSERGINPEIVYSSLENAVLIAYKKEFDIKEAENLAVELDRDTGKFRMIAKKEVVKRVTDKLTQISLKDASEIDSKVKVGEFVEVELPSQELGRIAAQTAKQVILQGINEAEKEAVLEEFSGKVGEVFTALMQRMQRGQAVFEIGKATAYMPLEEQIPGEFYRIGERYKVLLKEIKDSPNGKELIISRSDPQFLIALFEMEVPEISSKVVEVKAVAREAGSRSKMAVVSNQEGVDPIGSCVGQKGVRIANVMAELGEEKIDIIEWDAELPKFVENALSPAKSESVKVKDGVATVKVAEDQLSLAIGRDGQNVRLAAKLTIMKIDIQGPAKTEKKEEVVEEVETKEEEVVEEKE